MVDPENIKINCRSSRYLHIGRLVPHMISWMTPAFHIRNNCIGLLMDGELIIPRLKGSVCPCYYMASSSNSHQAINPPVLP